MTRLARPQIILGYFAVVAVLVIDALLVASSLSTIARSSADIDRSRAVIADLEYLMSNLKDAETGQRGFLLTGRDIYLEPYTTASSHLVGVRLGLQASATEDRARAPLIDELLRHARDKMTELQRTIVLRREQGLAAAMAIVETDLGRESMIGATRAADRLRAIERRVLGDRLASSRSAVRWAVGTFFVTTATALLLLVRVFYLQWRVIKGRDRSESLIREGSAWLSTTLVSIGDALIATDDQGRVRFMNPVAESLTGWTQVEAEGRPMAEVFKIINEATRLPVENPVEKVLREGNIVGLANHTTLVAKGGAETPIDDSAAPIKDADGKISGVVLVFRDITERRRQDAVIAEGSRLAEFGRDIGLALNESMNLAEILGQCAELTVRHLDGAFARIWTLDESSNVLVLAASAGLYTHLDGPHARVPVGRFKIGLIAQEREPHLTNHVVGDLRVSDPAWAAREGMVGFAGYPLLVDDRVVGVWAMFARHPLTEATLRAMQSVANGIALGIDRKRFVDALALSEGRKAAIFQNAIDAIITIDHEGRVVEFNPAAVRIFGHPLARAIGRPLDTLMIPPAMREAHHKGMARYLATGKSTVIGRRIELTALRADGGEFPVELAITRISTDGPPLFTAHLRDISERKRAEGRLEFLARAGIGLAESLDYGPTLVNVVQLAASGFADSCLFDLVTEDGERIERVAWAHRDPHQQKTMDRDWGAMPAEPLKGHPVETVIASGEVLKDDESCNLIVPVPIRGINRGVLTFGIPSPGPGFDASDIKLAEDFGRRAGAAVSNALLYYDAQEANRAKDTFLAVLSHELRTPLNPILLAVTAMLDNPSYPDELRPDLEMIRNNVALEARLIDDLLDVMRIVRGKMPLHWEVADTHDLMRQAVQICRSEVFGRELRLDLDLAADHRHINADPARLQQVFWNLIKNAVKFTPAGGRITIRTRNEPDPGDRYSRLIIEIADSGIGIAPEVIDSIFNPFQQGETSITRRFGGLGLGLAISKGIVEGHGGLITVQSLGKDKGTTFTIQLRTMPDPEVKPDGEPIPDPTSTEPEPTRSRVILLVEDEPATSRLMERLLRGLGHEVIAMSTIASAIEAERSREVDLVISDIGLPDGSGLELIRRVVARRGHVPAIALTGYGMEEDIQRSREAGFTAHMTKPIDFTKLEAMIRQVAR